MNCKICILILLLSTLFSYTVANQSISTTPVESGDYWVIDAIPHSLQYKQYLFAALPGGILHVRSSDSALIQWMSQHRYYKLPNEPFHLEDTIPGIQTDSTEIRSEAQHLNISSLWATGLTGSGFITAVIDSGIDFSHPSLVNKEVASKSFVNIANGYNDEEDEADLLGHGTEVASLIAGTGAGSEAGIYRGMANESLLVNAKVADGDGLITIKGLLTSFDWVVSLDYVDCINLSLGGLEESAAIEPFEAAARIAIEQGKYVFASAGNLGLHNQLDAFSVKSPGSNPDVITVGAVDSSNSIPYFSSEGPTQQLAMKPELLAPGVSVMVARLHRTFSNYTSASGTSFSTPLTAGVGILLLEYAQEHGLNLKIGALKVLLLESAQILPTSATQGNHLVDAGEALHLLKTNNYSSVWISPPLPNYIDYVPLGSSLTFGITIFTAELQQWKFTEIHTANVSITAEIVYHSSFSSVFRVTLTNRAGINTTYSTPLLFIGDHAISTQISVQLRAQASLKVLIDLRHTAYDILTGYSRVYSQEILNMLNTRVWFEENFSPLTYSILQHYDAIWLSDMTMHIIDEGVVSPQTEIALQPTELAALTQFKNQGGKFLIDFGGSSNRNNLITNMEYDLQSLETVLALFGMSISGSISTSIQNAKTIPGPVFADETLFSVGTTEISGGIPLIANDEGAVFASAYIGTNQSRAIVMNARNWRYTSYTSNIWNFFIEQQEVSISSTKNTNTWTVNVSYVTELHTAYLTAADMQIQSSLTYNTYSFSITPITTYFSSTAYLYVELTNYSFTQSFPIAQQALQLQFEDNKFTVTVPADFVLSVALLKIYVNDQLVGTPINYNSFTFEFTLTTTGNITVEYYANEFVVYRASVYVSTTTNTASTPAFEVSLLVVPILAVLSRKNRKIAENGLFVI